MPDENKEPQPFGWYRKLTLKFADETRATVFIERRPTGTHVPAVSPPAPWTKLGFNKCPCCPLPGERGYCPAAVSLQTTLDQFRYRTSTETVTATAVDEAGLEQTVTAPLAAIGAIMVQLAVLSSQCPVGRKLKPYLKGLPPFADYNELLQHVLKGLFGAKDGAAEGARKDIEEVVRPLHEVLVYLQRRLRGGDEPHQDVIPNSIVRVDAWAQLMRMEAERLNGELAAKLEWEKKPAA
jgi:hypothetical protein